MQNTESGALIEKKIIVKSSQNPSSQEAPITSSRAKESAKDHQVVDDDKKGRLTQRNISQSEFIRIPTIEGVQQDLEHELEEYRKGTLNTFRDGPK